MQFYHLLLKKNVAVFEVYIYGRVYDYQSGRFLSVGPFISMPGSSQAYNPYSYVMNNPLSYTDPSGYFIEDLIAGSSRSRGNQSSETDQNKPEECQSNWCSKVSYDDGSVEYVVHTGNGSGDGQSESSGTSSGCQVSIDCQGNGNGYDKSDTYYHAYTFFHKICSTDVSSCTVENVYNSLTKNAALADKATEIQMAGVSGGHVSHIIDSGNSRVVNITADDHIFYNGVVIRSVVQKNGIISIRSYGEGVNRTNWAKMPDRVSWAANYILAEPGFNQQDNNIRRQVLSLSSDGRVILRREEQFRQQ